TGSLSFVGEPGKLLSVFNQPAVVVGLAFIIFAVGFKLSLAPFHKWTPDVYAGAPAPIATFLATVAKMATLGLFARYVLSSGLLLSDSFITILTVIAVLSILVGNLLAVKQVNLKRILAYSSIAHFGYILVAIVTARNTDFLQVQGFATFESLNVYVITYVLTTVGAFGVVTLMSSPYNNTDEAGSLAEYRGLFWRRPVLTAVLTVMMLSLAGMPLTAGFIGKFLVIKTAVAGEAWCLAAMVILGSGIGLYYYLRVMVVMYMTPPETPRIDAVNHWGQKVGGIMVLAVALLVLVLGVYPDPMIAISKFAFFALSPELQQFIFTL